MENVIFGRRLSHLTKVHHMSKTMNVIVQGTNIPHGDDIVRAGCEVAVIFLNHTTPLLKL